MHKIKLHAEGNEVYLEELIDGAAATKFNGRGRRINNLTGLRAFPAKK